MTRVTAAACERALASGADAVQARSESRGGTSLAAEASLREVARVPGDEAVGGNAGGLGRK